MKGKRIYTLGHLAEAAAQRRSVVGWKYGGADDNPKPASFVLSMQAGLVMNRLSRGLYLYEPKTEKRFGKGGGMKPEDLIACIKAQMEGKAVERRRILSDKWQPKDTSSESWDTGNFEYRVARDPRKCWFRWRDDGLTESVHFVPGESADELRKMGWQLVVEDIR